MFLQYGFGTGLDMIGSISVRGGDSGGGGFVHGCGGGL